MAERFEPSNDPLLASGDKNAFDITPLTDTSEDTSLQDIQRSYQTLGSKYGGLVQNALQDVGTRQLKLIENDFGGVTPQLRSTYYEPAESSFKSAMNVEGTQRALEVGMERGKAAAEANYNAVVNEHNQAVSAYENFRKAVDNGEYTIATFDESLLPDGMTMEEFEGLSTIQGMTKEEYIDKMMGRLQDSGGHYGVNWGVEEDTRAANEAVFKKYNTTWEDVQKMSEQDRDKFWKSVGFDWRNAYYENQIRRSIPGNSDAAIDQYRESVRINTELFGKIYDAYHQGEQVLDNLGMLDNMCVTAFSIPVMKSQDTFDDNYGGGTSEYGMNDNYDTMSVAQRNNLTSPNWLKEHLDGETYNKAIQYMMDNNYAPGKTVDSARTWINGMFDVVKGKLRNDKGQTSDNSLAEYSYSSVAQILGFSLDDLKSYIALKRNNPEMLESMRHSFAMARGLTSIMEVANGTDYYLINGKYRQPAAGSVILMTMPGTTNEDGSFNSKEYEEAVKLLKDLNDPTANHTDEEKKALEKSINENFNAYYKQCAYQSAIQAIKPSRRDFKNMFLEALVLSDVEKYKEVGFTNNQGQTVTASEFLRDFNELIKKSSTEAYKFYSDSLYKAYEELGYIYTGSQNGSVYVTDIKNGDKKHTNIFSYDNDKEGSGSETYKQYGHGLSADTIFNLISSGINIYNKKGKSDKQADQDYSFYVDPSFMRNGVIDGNANVVDFAYGASQFAGIIWNFFAATGSFLATGFENTANAITGRASENKNPFTESKFVTWDALTGAINNYTNGLGNEIDGQTIEEMFTAPRIEDSYAQWYELNEHQQSHVARAINAVSMYTWFGDENGNVSSEGLGTNANANDTVSDNAFLKFLNENGYDFLGLSSMFAGDYQFWRGASKFAGTLAGFRMMSLATNKVAGAIKDAVNTTSTNISLALSDTILKEASTFNSVLASELAASTDIASTAASLSGTAAANSAIASGALGGKITTEAMRAAKVEFSRTAAKIANGTVDSTVIQDFAESFVNTVKSSKYYANVVEQLGEEGAKQFLSNMSTNAGAVMQEIVSNTAIGNATGLSALEVSKLTSRDQRLITRVIESMGEGMKAVNRNTWFTSEFLKSLTKEEFTDVVKAIISGSEKNAALGLAWTAEDTARILQSKGWLNASKSVFMKEFAKDMVGDLFRDNIRNLTNPYYTDEGYKRQTVEQYFTNPITYIQNFLSSVFQFGKQRIKAEVMTSYSTYKLGKARNALSSTGDGNNTGSTTAMVRASYWAKQAQKWSNAAFRSGANYKRIKAQIDSTNKYTRASWKEIVDQMGISDDSMFSLEIGGTRYKFENTEEFKKWAEENKVDPFDAINAGLKNSIIDAEGRYVVNTVELGGDVVRGLGNLNSKDMLIDMHRIEIDIREKNLQDVKADKNLTIYDKSKKLYDLMVDAIVAKYGKSDAVDGLEKSLRFYYQNFLDELDARVTYLKSKGLSEEEILDRNMVRLGYTPIASWYNQTPFEDKVLRGFGWGSQTIDKLATDTTMSRQVHDKDLLNAFARGDKTYQLLNDKGGVVKEYVLDPRGLNYLDSLTVYQNSNLAKMVLKPIFDSEINGKFNFAGSAMKMRYAYVESTDAANMAAKAKLSEANTKINKIVEDVKQNYVNMETGATAESVKAYEDAKVKAEAEAAAVLERNVSNKEKLLEYAQKVREDRENARRVDDMNAGKLPKDFEALPALVLGLYTPDGISEFSPKNINIDAGKQLYDIAIKDTARIIKYYNDGVLDDSGTLTYIKGQDIDADVVKARDYTYTNEKGELVKESVPEDQADMFSKIDNEEVISTNKIKLRDGVEITLDENDMAKIQYAAANGQAYDMDLVTSIMIKSYKAQIDSKYNAIKEARDKWLEKAKSDLVKSEEETNDFIAHPGKNAVEGEAAKGFAPDMETLPFERATDMIMQQVLKTAGVKSDEVRVLGTNSNDIAQAVLRGMLSKSRADDEAAGVNNSVITSAISKVYRDLSTREASGKEGREAAAQRRYRQMDRKAYDQKVKVVTEELRRSLKNPLIKAGSSLGDAVFKYDNYVKQYGDFGDSETKDAYAMAKGHLNQQGVKIEDWTGRKYNAGMNAGLIVVTEKGKAAAENEQYIINVRRPAIYEKGKLVRKPDIEVGTKDEIVDRSKGWRELQEYMYKDTGFSKNIEISPDGTTISVPMSLGETEYTTFTVDANGRYSAGSETVFNTVFDAIGRNMAKFNKSGELDRTDVKLLAALRTQLDTQIRTEVGTTITIGELGQRLLSMMPDTKIYSIAKEFGLIEKFTALDADNITVSQFRDIIVNDFITKKTAGKLSEADEDKYLQAISLLSNMEESSARPRLRVDTEKLAARGSDEENYDDDIVEAGETVAGTSGVRPQSDAEEFLAKYGNEKTESVQAYDRNSVISATNALGEIMNGIYNKRNTFYSESLANAKRGRQDVDNYIDNQINSDGKSKSSIDLLKKAKEVYKTNETYKAMVDSWANHRKEMQKKAGVETIKSEPTDNDYLNALGLVRPGYELSSTGNSKNHRTADEYYAAISNMDSPAELTLGYNESNYNRMYVFANRKGAHLEQLANAVEMLREFGADIKDITPEIDEQVSKLDYSQLTLSQLNKIKDAGPLMMLPSETESAWKKAMINGETLTYNDISKWQTAKRQLAEAQANIRSAKSMAEARLYREDLNDADARLNEVYAKFKSNQSRSDVDSMFEEAIVALSQKNADIFDLARRSGLSSETFVKDVVDNIENSFYGVASYVHDPSVEKIYTLSRDEAGKYADSLQKQIKTLESRIPKKDKPGEFEASTAGHKEFSALNAKFASGTEIMDIDISGKTIEDVFQNILKGSGKNKAPAENSPISKAVAEAERKAGRKLTDAEKNTVTQNFLNRLYDIWGEQNPELKAQIEALPKGTKITDKFAREGHASQAVALQRWVRPESFDDFARFRNENGEISVESESALLQAEKLKSIGRMRESAEIREAIDARGEEIEAWREKAEPYYKEANEYGKKVATEKGLTEGDDDFLEAQTGAFLEYIEQKIGKKPNYDDINERMDAAKAEMEAEKVGYLYFGDALRSGELTDTLPSTKFVDMQSLTRGDVRRALYKKGYDNINDPRIKADIDKADNSFVQRLAEPMVLARGETSFSGRKLKKGEKVDSSSYTYLGGAGDYVESYRRGMTTVDHLSLGGGTLYLYHLKKGQPIYHDPEGLEREFILPRDADVTITNVRRDIKGIFSPKKHPLTIVEVEVNPNSGITPNLPKTNNLNTVKTYSGDITPDENTVFVFGSNPKGVNGRLNAYGEGKDSGGAAAVAQRNFGVEQGEIMDNKLSGSGKAYGLVTVTEPGAKRSLTPEQITENIKQMYSTAEQNPDKQFKVAYRSDNNLNGYSLDELATMFKNAGNVPDNVYFSEEMAKRMASEASAPAPVEVVNAPGGSRAAKSYANEIGGVSTLRVKDSNEHFGNPWSAPGYDGTIKVDSVDTSVKNFEAWLRGTDFKDVQPERRQWILNQIDSGALDGKKLVYYTDNVDSGDKTLDYYGNKIKDGSAVTKYDPETAPNHAHILAKFINERRGARTIDDSGYTNHSGGALGSDSEWGELGSAYGVKSNHYYHGAKTPKGNVKISDADFEEGRQHVLQANKTLQRQNPEKYMDLLARNWQQVKNADAVFAIGERQTRNIRENAGVTTGNAISKPMVNGGTGWAVQMALDAGKPVYVFDQNVGRWYTIEDNRWKPIETPVLTKNFAGIGTRELNEKGKAAIREVYAKTFGENTRDDVELMRLRKQYAYFKDYEQHQYVDPTTGKRSFFTRQQVDNNLPGYTYEFQEKSGAYVPPMRPIVTLDQLSSSVKDKIDNVVTARLPRGRKDIPMVLHEGQTVDGAKELELTVYGKYTPEQIQGLILSAYGADIHEYDIVGSPRRGFELKNQTQEGIADVYETRKDLRWMEDFDDIWMRSRVFAENPNIKEEYKNAQEEVKKAVKRVADARALGDLSENEEYSSARKELSQRLNDLEEIRKRLKTPRYITERGEKLENPNYVEGGDEPKYIYGPSKRVKNPKYVETDDSELRKMYHPNNFYVWRLVFKDDSTLYDNTEGYEESQAKQFKEGLDLGEGWVPGGEYDMKTFRSGIELTKDAMSKSLISARKADELIDEANVGPEARARINEPTSYFAQLLSSIMGDQYTPQVQAEIDYANAYDAYLRLSSDYTKYKQNVLAKANSNNKRFMTALKKYEQYFADANPDLLLMEQLLTGNKKQWNKMMKKKATAEKELAGAEEELRFVTGQETFEQLKAYIAQKHEAEKFLNSKDDRAVYTSPEGDVFTRDGNKLPGYARQDDILKSLGWEDAPENTNDLSTEALTKMYEVLKSGGSKEKAKKAAMEVQKSLNEEAREKDLYSKENRKKRKQMQKEINKILNQNTSGKREYKPYEGVDFSHLDKTSMEATRNNLLDFKDSMSDLLRTRYGIEGGVDPMMDKHYVDMLQVIVPRDKSGTDKMPKPGKDDKFGEKAKYLGKQSINKFLTITRAGVSLAKSTQDFQMAGGFANINAMTIVQLRQYMYQQFSLNPLKATKSIKDFLNVAYNTRNSAAAYEMATELMPFLQKNASLIGDTNLLTGLNGVLNRSPGYDDGGTVNALVSNWLRHIDEMKTSDDGAGEKIKKLLIGNRKEDLEALFSDATFKNTLPLFRAWMLKQNYDEAMRYLKRTKKAQGMTADELDTTCHLAAYGKTLEFFEPAKTRGKTLAEIVQNVGTLEDRRRLASFTGMKRGASYLDVAGNVFFALRYKMALGGQVLSGVRELTPAAMIRRGRTVLGNGRIATDENGNPIPGRNDYLDSFVHSGSLRGIGALATIAIICHFWSNAMGIPSAWDSTQYIDEKGNFVIPEILKKFQTIGQFWIPNEYSKEKGFYFDPNKKMVGIDNMSSTFTLPNSVFKTVDKSVNTKAYNHNQRGIGLFGQMLGINPQGINDVLNNDIAAAIGDELIASNMLSPWKAMYEVLTDNTYFGNNIWEKKYLEDGSINKNYDPFRNVTASFFHLLNLDWFLTNGTNAWVKGKYQDYDNRVLNPNYVAQDNIGTVAGSGVFQHEFLTAAINIINGQALDGIVEAGELPIKTKNLSTQARTEFNTKVKNTIMQLAEEYKAKVKNITDPDAKDAYYREFVKEAADTVASWSKKWNYVLGENQELVAYATRALMAICAGEYDDNLNYVQNAYWKASQIAQIEQPANLFLGDEDLEEWIKSGKTEEEFAQEREKRSAAWNQALLDEYDAIKALEDAGVDTSYLTREAGDYFGAMKSSVNKRIYEGIHDVLNKPVGQFKNFKEMKAYYEEQINAATSTKAKSALAEKYNGYLKEALAPFVMEYGEGIFRTGYYNKEGLANSIAEYVIIPADKYYRGKTPQASYLKDMYGVGYTNKSNMPSDDEVIERYAQAMKAANKGSAASALRLLDGIIKDVKNGRLYVTDRDYSRIVNMKALLSARSKQ